MFGEDILREQVMTDILENPTFNDVEDEELDKMVEEEVRKQIIPVKDTDFTNYMGDLVEFSDDLKFGRIFELIIKNKDIFNNIFKNNLNGVIIDDFINDFEKKPSRRKKIPITLLMYWLCIYESYDYEDDDDSFTIIHEIPTFGGVDIDKDAKIIKEAVDIAISYASLSDLKSYNIRMDGSVQFAEYAANDEMPIMIFSCDVKFFTLFDIICGILDEITKKGKPSERDKKRKGLEEKIKELNKGMKKTSKDTIEIITNYENPSDSKSVPVEDPHKSLENMKIEELLGEQERAAENEDYEKAAKIRDIIKKKQKLI